MDWLGEDEAFQPSATSIWSEGTDCVQSIWMFHCERRKRGAAQTWTRFAHASALARRGRSATTCICCALPRLLFTLDLPLSIFLNLPTSIYALSSLLVSPPSLSHFLTPAQHLDVTVVEHSAHASTAEQLPPAHELETLLNIMIKDLNIPPESEALIRNKTPEEQWLMIQPHMRTRTNDDAEAAEDLQQQLNDIQDSLAEETEESLEVRCAILDSLAVALRSKPVHYVELFVGLGGLTLLLDILVLLDPSGSYVLFLSVCLWMSSAFLFFRLFTFLF